MPTFTRRALGALVAISLAACAHSQAATPSPPTLASTTVDPTTAPTGTPYATTTFSHPFEVVIPSWLPREPTIAEADFVTWTPTTGADRAVRVLHPVAVYPPDSTQAVAPPSDYAGYILGLAEHGATLSDQRTITIDGQPALEVTAASTGDLDGALGCPETSMLAGDCFGLNPDVVVRLAVIGSGADTVLVWLREKPGTDAGPDTAVFETMLDTLHFTNAPVATTSTVPASVQGRYTWTISADDALAHDPNPPTPDDLKTFPWVFSIEMSDGRWHLTHVDGPDHVAVDEGRGTYTSTAGTIAFTWSGSVLTFGYTIDADGAIHLEPHQPMNSGDAFVWALHPWQPAS